MIRRFIDRLSYANVMATVAVFISIGGGAYAAKLAKDSVGSKQIKANAVKSDELAKNAVTSRKVADGSLRNQDLKAPETWHEVGPASTPPAPDFCVDPSNTGVFCDEFPGGQNPWDNYGGGFATAAFYKDQLGIVHLRGLVHATSNSGGVNPMERAIFRLPAGYRPDQRRMFASVGQDGIGGVEVAPARIDVYPDGLVTFINDCATGVSNCSATGPFVTLDGISFRPDE